MQEPDTSTKAHFQLETGFSTEQWVSPHRSSAIPGDSEPFCILTTAGRNLVLTQATVDEKKLRRFSYAGSSESRRTPPDINLAPLRADRMSTSAGMSSFSCKLRIMFNDRSLFPRMTSYTRVRWPMTPINARESLPFCSFSGFAPILLRGESFRETSLQLRRKSTLGQAKCRVSDSSNALIPFQAICTPMQTRKNDDNCVITVIPVAPRIRAKRSANP
jgi:hypothetical protein